MKTNKFETNGTEGMLDVILGCTLIFILLSALIHVDGEKSQEMTLPEMDITKVNAKSNGADAVKKTVISIKNSNGAITLFIGDKQVPMERVKNELSQMGTVAQVALRREKSIPCEIEDQVITACRDAGVNRVAIMVKTKEPQRRGRD